MNRIRPSSLSSSCRCFSPLPLPLPSSSLPLFLLHQRAFSHSTPSPRSLLLSSSHPLSCLPTLISSTTNSLRPLTLLAQPPPSPPPDFDPPELDSPPGNLVVTDRAISQLVKAQEKAGQELALKISVESGGCHGYQYKLNVVQKREEDDYLFSPESSTVKLLVDSVSLPLLSGATVDYATELIGSSFRIVGNPNAKDGGGCGCGVSWELKD